MSLHVALTDKFTIAPDDQDLGPISLKVILKAAGPIRDLSQASAF